MNMLASKFPDSIWRLIFQFDDTYHSIYKLLVKEFYLKTSFWRIKWLNNGLGYGRGPCYETIKYDSYRHQVLSLTEYWNMTSLPILKNNCTDVFITDENPGGHKKVLDRLEVLKKYTPTKNNDDIKTSCYKLQKILRS